MNEIKTKKFQRKFKMFCWIITLIFYSLFVIVEYNNFQNSNYSYTKNPIYNFGVFLAFSIFPFLFWIIYTITLLVQNKKIRDWNKMKLSKIFNSSEYGQVFSTKLNNLNELFQVNAISVEEYELKKKLLIRSTEKLVDYSNNLKENQIQIEKLKEALDLEVINEEEYQNKVKKFNEIESVIKQRIDNIKAEDMINNSK